MLVKEQVQEVLLKAHLLHADRVGLQNHHRAVRMNTSLWDLEEMVQFYIRDF